MFKIQVLLLALVVLALFCVSKCEQINNEEKASDESVSLIFYSISNINSKFNLEFYFKLGVKKQVITNLVYRSRKHRRFQ